MSRFSQYLFLFSIVSTVSFGQQKSNDFTKRFHSFDGKMNRFSGKFFSKQGLNTKFNNRIKIEKWPSLHSIHSNRRLEGTTLDKLNSKSINVNNIPYDMPIQNNFSEMNQVKALNPNLREPSSASASIEFRDAVYDELDKRVDDWMSKVNNMSLQYINRYQFRRGRSSTPGFPVQQAGSERKNSKSGSFTRPNAIKSSGSGYWLGPMKSSVEATKHLSPKEQAIPKPPKGGFRAKTKPILGPMKVRVEVSAPK